MGQTWKSRWAAAAFAVMALSSVPATAQQGDANPGAKPAKPGPAAGTPAPKGPKGPKAAKSPVEPPAAPANIDVLATRAVFAGSDVEKAAAAAQRLGASRQGGALDALLDGLALGLHPRVAAAALDAVAGHRSASAIDVLVLYARNRNPELRGRAILALGQIEDKRARVAAWTGFHDADKGVRAASCKVAETTKDKSATDLLVQLLVKGDEASATAIAANAAPDLARKLGELIGQAPDDLLARTLGLVLLRNDFGKEEVYVEVVVTIGKIPGAEAVVALSSFISATPEKPPRLSRRKAQEIYEMRLSGGN